MFDSSFDWGAEAPSWMHSLCATPQTAFLDFPKDVAIWLADSPSRTRRASSESFSSVQYLCAIAYPLILASHSISRANKSLTNPRFGLCDGSLMFKKPLLLLSLPLNCLLQGEVQIREYSLRLPVSQSPKEPIRQAELLSAAPHRVVGITWAARLSIDEALSHG
jgi:hypothetical protein